MWYVLPLRVIGLLRGMLFDVTIVSGSIPKGVDADAPVSLPANEAEVAREGDGVSREILGRTS
ncbi:MAG: hypothetical protein OXF02_03190 [Simkaniaceae bacterium]|nr:hypothetical protein [Simkaniaceae bacterium]